LGVVGGIGSHLQWSERLDARLAGALMSIQAIKGVEIGLGCEASRRRGSAVHAPIEPAPGGGVRRPTNHAGGLEGGTTNGEAIVVRAAMKPISTLRRPLPSVDLATGQPVAASYERSDVCAVSACSVIAQAMVALVVADALLARVGGETRAEFVARAAILSRAAPVGPTDAAAPGMHRGDAASSPPP
jgi:chorismate synthase